MRVLVVEDQEAAARTAADELRQTLGCEVVVARDPLTGIACLRSEPFDVVIVDLLFRACTESFERRRRSKQVRLTDSELHLSGLAVLHAVRLLRDGPRPVVWTSGEPNRHLHLLFAYEELQARAFCSKEELGRLDVAVRQALAGEEYVDPRLAYYLPAGGHGRLLRETILSQPKKLGIWRTIALGQHRHWVIARTLGMNAKAVRVSMGEMRRRLLELDPGLDVSNNPSTEVVRYASQNWEFLLDDTVRRLFP